MHLLHKTINYTHFPFRPPRNHPQRNRQKTAQPPTAQPPTAKPPKNSATANSATAYSTAAHSATANSATAHSTAALSGQIMAAVRSLFRLSIYPYRKPSKKTNGKPLVDAVLRIRIKIIRIWHKEHGSGSYPDLKDRSGSTNPAL